MNELPLSPLSALDRAFLFLDRCNQPSHVAYLSLFTAPQPASQDFVYELAAGLRAATVATPPFNRRLTRRFGGDWWVEDRDFDVEQHFVHLSLPQPGRMKDLMGLVARLHGSHLDRSCPLWRVYLIEGLSDGRIAAYCKMHHAMADGVAATRLMLKCMSSDRTECQPAPWATAPAITAAGRPRPAHREPGIAGSLWSGLSTLSGVLEDVRKTARDVREGHAEVVGGRQAPSSILNQRISASREFAARSYSLSRIKALGRSFGATINDIALHLCSTALRSLLVELDALPDESLIAMVPMSMRRDDSGQGTAWGNQVVPLLVRLGTDVDDPLERLRLICRSAQHSKARYLGLSPGEAYAYTLASSGLGLIKLLLKPSGGRLPFNLVISNVPGPRTPMYWQGCQLEAMYPMSVLVDGLALNITFASRCGWLDFGLLSCRRTLPQVQRLLVYLEDALNELEKLAALQAPVTQMRQPIRLHRLRLGVGAWPRREKLPREDPAIAATAGGAKSAESIAA